jgi:PST family polysaccharide transporter
MMATVKMSSVGDKTKESILWNTIMPAGMQVFRFVISIVIARILDPVDFGIMGIVSVIVFYTNVISNFGFSTALVQKKDITAAHIDSIFSVNFLISLFLVVLVISLADVFAVFFAIPQLTQVVPVFSVIIIISSFYLVPLTLLRRDLSFKHVAKVEFVKGVIQALVTLLLAFNGFKYWSLIIGTITSHLVATLLILWVSRWRPHFALNVIALREMVVFASWNFGAAQVRLLNEYIDKLIIGKFLGPVALGFYEKAFGIAFMPVDSIASRISGVMFSVFSRCQDDRKELTHYFKRALVGTSVVCFPIFGGLFVVADIFVAVCLGDKWSPMVGSFKLLLIAFSVSSITAIFGMLNISAGSYKQQIRGRFISLLVFIPFLMVAARYSIEIVSVVVLLNYIGLCLYSLLLATKTLRLSYRDVMDSVLPAILSSTIMYTSVSLAKTYLLTGQDFINLIVLAFLGVVSYLVSFFLIKSQHTLFLKEMVILSVNSTYPIIKKHIRKLYNG